ncbi:ATP-binding protein [Nonomuraea wenchangensis]|uniref:Anti-sigma regulatory factor (Ser/Thr protein kinase) n=1 Tax=Nonomuraea wenchangensis TaxID=568860 RepID=A0A1I0JTE0_9ACTN|nr:ATP-binding protein [Nonomuraea wenchangensis]SEU14060.1 Anti-sigma regulatory factor (Ser/Thr protein kinase) [Nonomuraea wenchangensis]
MTGQFLAELVLPGELGSVRVARHCVKIILTAAGHQDVTDVQLVVTELVANAVQHSISGLAGGLITLDVRSIGDQLARIDVMDDGGLTVPRIRRSHTLDCSGRGLHLVAETALRWGVGDNALGGRVIWAEVLTAARAPAAAPDLAEVR